MIPNGDVGSEVVLTTGKQKHRTARFESALCSVYFNRESTFSWQWNLNPSRYGTVLRRKRVCSWGWCEVEVLVVQLCSTLWPHGLWPTRLLCPWDSPGKNTGGGCHSLLQGIVPTQGQNPGLLHYRQILYCLSHRRSPFLALFFHLQQ